MDLWLWRLDIHFCNKPEKVHKVSVTNEFYCEFPKEKVTDEFLMIQDPDEVANRLSYVMNVILDCKWPVQ